MKADGRPLERCGSCNRTWYCSREHQVADWKAGHKAECAALQKAGEAASGDGGGGGDTTVAVGGSA